MLRITLDVACPEGYIGAVKETLAMYLERFGDVRIISVVPKEEAVQLQMEGLTDDVRRAESTSGTVAGIATCVRAVRETLQQGFSGGAKP